MGKTRLFGVVACAVAVMGVGASGAFAGEIALHGGKLVRVQVHIVIAQREAHHPRAKSREGFVLARRIVPKKKASGEKRNRRREGERGFRAI